jgi:hypothetical protein
MKLIGVISTTALFLLLGITVSAGGQQERQGKQEATPPKQEQQAKPEKQQQQQAKPAKQQQQQQAKGQQQQQKQQATSAKQQQQQAKGQQQEQQKQQKQQQATSAKQQQQQAKGQQQEQQKQQQQQAKGRQEQQRQQQQRTQQEQRQPQGNRSVQQRSPAQVRQQQTAWQHDRARNWQSEHRTWQQRGGYHGYRVPEDRFRSYYGQDHFFRFYSLPVRIVGGHRRFRYGGYWFSLVDPWPEYWSSDWYDNDDVYVDYYGDGYYLFNRRYPGDRIAISFYLN